MTFSFEKKLILIFSIIFIAIIVIGIATFRNNQSISDTDKLVQHTHQVLYESEEVFSSVQDIVSITRGFVITGDTNFLKPVIKSSNTIDIHINNLKTLTKDNAPQQARIDSLTNLIKARIDFSIHITGIALNATAICKHILFFTTRNATAEKNKKSLQANTRDSATTAACKLSPTSP